MQTGRITEIDTSASPATVTVDMGDGDLAEASLVRGADVPMVGDTATVIGVEDDDAVAIASRPDAVAAPGEFHGYARDSGGGTAAKIHIMADGTVSISNAHGAFELGADGSIRLTNANGGVELGADGAIRLSGPVATVELEPAGNVTINGATVTAIGDVQTPTGVSLLLHTHTCAAPGSPTTPPIPTP